MEFRYRLSFLIMSREELFQLLLTSFRFTPTEGQKTVLRHLSAFLLSAKANPTYLIRGYAGTGKTTLITTLVKTLPMINYRFVLLAPTGRAAKVMSSYTGQNAATLHRKLYQFSSFADGTTKMTRAANKHQDTVFIVDEASMIDDEKIESNYRSDASLLDDLVNYVFSGSNCKLLLIGDSAQLPPVGRDDSPALNDAVMKNAFSLTLASFELTEVKRQALQSGILANATHLRELIAQNDLEYPLPIFQVTDFDDVSKVDPQEFEELLFDAFGKDKTPESVVICKSNKRANLFNQAIRSRILNIEGEIATGDQLMVVKNNYYWSDADQKNSFIANGDLVEIKRINRFEELYGFHFADVAIGFVDDAELPNLDVKIILETLNSTSPALTCEENDRLFHAVEEDYLDYPNKRERYAEMKKNPWLNALQIKFGYALTCHKTQGGQWQNVFIDSSFNQKECLEQGDLRWLYTAITRAETKLYFVNFKEEFFR